MQRRGKKMTKIAEAKVAGALQPDLQGEKIAMLALQTSMGKLFQALENASPTQRETVLGYIKGVNALADKSVGEIAKAHKFQVAEEISGEKCKVTILSVDHDRGIAAGLLKADPDSGLLGVKASGKKLHFHFSEGKWRSTELVSLEGAGKKCGPAPAGINLVSQKDGKFTAPTVEVDAARLLNKLG
jgi:hypothetical protein